MAKVLLQESENCRIVQKWASPFDGLIGVVIARQRKKWWGWATTAWLYSNQLPTVNQYKTHFDYQESCSRYNIGNKKQF